MGGYLVWRNHADTATLSAINPYTGLAAVMLRPLTELQVPRGRGLMRGPANGTGIGVPASLEIRADLGDYKTIHAIGIIGLNGVTFTNGTFQLSNVAPGAGEVGGGSFAWEPDDIAEDFGQNGFLMCDYPGFLARYVTVSIEVWGRPVGQRYVDSRRLLIMEGAVFPDGVNFDWSGIPDDLSIIETTPKGGVFVSEQQSVREMSFGISGMSLAEAKTNRTANQGVDSLQRVFYKAGKHTEVLFSPRQYADPSDQTDNTLYALLSDYTPIQHAGGDLYDCERVTLREITCPPLS